jgi:hypothetical protein
LLKHGIAVHCKLSHQEIALLAEDNYKAGRSASMQLDFARDDIPPESSVKPRLDRILEIMNRGIEEGRSTIQGLRSSDPSASDLVCGCWGGARKFAAHGSGGLILSPFYFSW